MIFSLRRLVYSVVFLALPAFATVSIPLTWKPSIDSTVAGYKIYYGVASHAYANSVNIGNVTKTTISGLVAKTTYYFAATTYDVYGNESDFSNEAMLGTGVVDPPPTDPPPTKPPTIDLIGDLTAYYKTNSTINLSGITSGASSGKKLKITASSSNSKIVANPKVKFSSLLGTGTLTLKPAKNTNATVTITVTLNNGARSNNILTRTFIVTVEPVVIPSKAKKVVVADVAVSDSSVLINGPKASLVVYPPAAATLTPMQCAPGQFALSVAGVTNYPCVVQASTDLIEWVPVQTNTAPFTFVDSNASQFTQRFYRAASLPLP